MKRPLLIVPPWINKYYIMDLQEKKSLLKWLVDQGHTVFVISWVNPDEKYADVGFDEYVKEGVLTAIDVIEQITGESEMNSIGYCLGGTLLTTTLAYMASKKDNRIKSATCFTTMLDFSEPGDLGVFIDEDQIQGVEERMAENGYLDGRAMSGVFNLLRFREPGGITIDGVAIDLSTINTPMCFVSAIEDHIAPWRSTYMGAKLFIGDIRFILGNSGHIAGIINPPAANKYGYRLTDSLPDDEQKWAQETEVIEGSWWSEWNRWIRPLSGNVEVAAREEGGGVYDIIEDAPGIYVKCTTSEKTPVLEPTVLIKQQPTKASGKASGTKAKKRTTTRKKTRARTVATKKKTPRKSAPVRTATKRTAAKKTTVGKATKEKNETQAKPTATKKQSLPEKD